MNTDVEDLLREGMARFTADLQAPAGMVRRAEQRRRRRLAQRSVVSVAALAACALVLVSVLLPGAHYNGTHRPLVDMAYVTKRVDGALRAAGPAAIAHMTVTTNALGGTTTSEEWSYGDRWRSVVYSSARQPVFDEGGTPSTFTLVNYSARTWARARGVGGQAAPAPASGPSGCLGAAVALSFMFRPGMPAIGLPASSPPASVVKLLRTAISCGTLTEAGHQRVDGIEATELTSSFRSLISETIWISPTTYLPVRVIIRSAPGSPVSQHTADITWLKPTAQNRAELTVPIPAGFRRVPFGPTVRRISP
jgi:hypothetical protein